MDTNRQSTKFTIRSHLWKNTNKDFKSDIASLLKTDLKCAENFCNEYFNKFFLLHKIGHIILHKYDPLHHANPAYTEYCANLFAYKYLEYKKEYKYLEGLTHYVSSLLKKNDAVFDFDVERMDKLYSKYKMDITTYTAFHFNSLIKCINSLEDLPEVLKNISKGVLTQINSGIIFRKGLSGMDLVNECIGTIFELNDDVPEVTLKYCEDLSLNNFDLELG